LKKKKKKKKKDVVNLVSNEQPSLQPDDLLVQSTQLPIFIPRLDDEESFCLLSSKSFKEIIEEESQEVNQWKWIFIGSTTIIGGVIAFRIWRYYQRKKRAEELAQAEGRQLQNEIERLSMTTTVESSRNYIKINK